MLVLGVPAGILTMVLGAPIVAPVVGWAVACAAYVVATWAAVRGLDAGATREHALAEDPSRGITETALLLATVVSLAAVGVMLTTAGESDLTNRVYGVLAVASVAGSWLLIHTLYTLRYAAAYYGGDHAGGISFNTDEPPRYVDFAYTSFTVGMTYQIADTNLESSDLRSLALRHAVLSYLFGTVIVVTAINLALSLVG